MVAQSHQFAKTSLTAGFSLLEVLMAIVIVGMLFAVVIISFDPFASSDNELEQQADELDYLFEKVIEDALLTNQQYGVRLYSNGYDVLQHGVIDTSNGPLPAWLAVEAPWAQRRFPEHYVLSMSLNGAAMETPQKTTADETRTDTLTNSRAEPILPEPPHILLLSSGETTQTKIRLTDTKTSLSVYVSLDPLGRAVTHWESEPENLSSVAF